MKRLLHTALILSGLCLAALHAAKAEDDARQLEYQVKAACIYNFAKFIEWPAEAFTAQPPQTINFCLLGANPFGELWSSLHGRQAQGRTVNVQPVNTDLNRCQIVFLGEGADQKSLSKLAGRPIVTVSDTYPEAVIHFRVVDGKIKFSIDLEAARASGVKISSQLLKLAI